MSKPSHRILVVDDSATVRKYLEKGLCKEGFLVDCAENGIEALALLAKDAPHVILVDFLMPEMNGHSFCKKVRAMEELAEVPIVLISSRAESVASYFEGTIGKIYVMMKPLAIPDLLGLLDDILPELEQEQAREADPGEEHPVQDVPADGDDVIDVIQPQGQVSVDLDALTERVDRVVAQYFHGSFPHLLKQVLHDTLRQSGLIGSDEMILSGTLESVGLPDALNFIATAGLTGRLSVLSRWCLGEIFVDSGEFVFASISRKGSHEFLTDLIFDKPMSPGDRKKVLAAVEGARLTQTRVGRQLVASGVISEERLAKAVRTHSQRALNVLLEVECGHFYLEDLPLPSFLRDVDERKPLMQVLMDGLRILDESRREFRDGEAVFVRLMDNREAIETFDLKRDEIEVLSRINGVRNLGELAKASDSSLLETARICYTLKRVGVTRLLKNSALAQASA